jgi:hypothetical protein
MLRAVLTPFALALALCVVGCGGSTPADPVAAAEEALQKGDSSKAVSLLRSAVADMKSGTPDHHEALVLLCSALAEEKAEEARDLFLDFAKQYPDVVSPRNFKDVQSYLQTYGHYAVAVDVMDAGLKRWQDDPVMVEMKNKLIAAAQSAADPEALEKLKGLGYM